MEQQVSNLMDFSDWGYLAILVVTWLVGSVLEKNKKKAKRAAKTNSPATPDTTTSGHESSPADPLASMQEVLAKIRQLQEGVALRHDARQPRKDVVDVLDSQPESDLLQPVAQEVDAPMELPADEGLTDFHSINSAPLSSSTLPSDSQPKAVPSFVEPMPQHATATSSLPDVLDDQQLCGTLGRTSEALPLSPAVQSLHSRHAAVDARSAMIAAIILTPHRSRAGWRRY